LKSRCEVVKHYLERCQERYSQQQHQLQELKTLSAGVAADSCRVRVDRVSAANVRTRQTEIASRADSVLAKLKRIKRPLNEAELEIRRSLIELESKTSFYRAKATSVRIRQLRREVISLKSDQAGLKLDGTHPPDSELELLMRSLQTYSEKINRLESLREN
jgi:Arc/MetJ-type ribon-helix-helix transcriptional regulator